MDDTNFMSFDKATYIMAGPYYRELVNKITSDNPVPIRGLAVAAGINYQNLLRFLKGSPMNFINMDLLRVYIDANFGEYLKDGGNNVPVV